VDAPQGVDEVRPPAPPAFQRLNPQQAAIRRQDESGVIASLPHAFAKAELSERLIRRDARPGSSGGARGRTGRASPPDPSHAAPTNELMASAAANSWSHLHGHYVRRYC
jgi:hypothetical protein